MHRLPVKVRTVRLVQHRLVGIECDVSRWHQWFAQHVGSTGEFRLADHLALAKHENDLQFVSLDSFAGGGGAVATE